MFKSPLPYFARSLGAAAALVLWAPGAFGDGLEGLSEAQVDQAISALQQQYVRPDKLSAADLKRDTLRGLLGRLRPGVALAQPAAKAVEAGPTRHEILPREIGYVRLGAIAAEQVTALEAALKEFTGKGVKSVILDLRATPESSDFEQAAEVCRRFCPKGRPLFSVKRQQEKDLLFTTRGEPLFSGLLVVLTSESLAGAAESVAGALQREVKAMIVGGKTQGAAAEFATVSLAGDAALRVAVAEVVLANGETLFLQGVKPDLAVEAPAETTAAVLQQQLEGGVAPLVYETERVRMNEAALVAGQNPELDALQEAQKRRGERQKAPLRDVVLQRAVDFITTLSMLQKK